VQHFRISLLPMMRMESQDERPPTSLKPTSLKPKSLKPTSLKRDEAGRDEASLLLNPWKHLPNNAASKACDNSGHNSPTICQTTTVKKGMHTKRNAHPKSTPDPGDSLAHARSKQ